MDTYCHPERISFRFHARYLLKGGKFYRLVIVHYRRLHSHFAFTTLSLKLKLVDKRLVFGQKKEQIFLYVPGVGI